MAGKRQKYEVRTVGEPGSTSAVEALPGDPPVDDPVKALKALKALMYADQGLKDQLTWISQSSPELKPVLAAIDAGRCKEALRKAGKLVAAGSPSPQTATLLLAHARASCGDRAGAIELLKGFLEKAQGSSWLTLTTWHRLRELGAEPAPEDAHRVLGVIIDINFLDEPETVVAYADGSSRYFGGGGTFLGEKRRPIVQELAKVIVSTASRFAGPAKKDPGPHALPEQNTFRFTFLTPSGPLVSTFTDEAMEGGKSELAAFMTLVVEMVKLKTQGGVD